jgi:catechol 2,3-dioxygenase-like lactoylglutathione lyase family enzyme
MKIKGVGHVGVVVRDVEASRKLWEGCFELVTLPVCTALCARVILE